MPPDDTRREASNALTESRRKVDEWRRRQDLVRHWEVEQRRQKDLTAGLTPAAPYSPCPSSAPPLLHPGSGESDPDINPRYWEAYWQDLGGSAKGPSGSVAGKYLLRVYDRSDLERVIADRVLGHEGAARYNVNANPVFFIDSRGPLRRVLIRTVQHPWFDRVVLALIILNCLIEFLDAPSLKDEDWARHLTYYSEVFFVVAFTSEAMVKTGAMGFVLHRKSYLRDAWNCLDFAILVFSYAMLVAESGGSFIIIRFVRVLRPLRALRRSSGIRTLFATYLIAGPILRDVLLLLLIVVFMFAILGIQLWNGSLHQRCYAYPIASELDNLTLANYSFTPADVGLPVLVRNDTDPCGGGRSCDPIPGFDVLCEIHTEIYHSYVANFDNILSSLFQVVRVVTLDDWPDEMFTVQDASRTSAWIYFVLLVLIGGYFLLHMVVAVLTVSFAEATHSKSAVKSRIVPASSIEVACMTQLVYLHSRCGDKRPFQSKLHMIDMAILKERQRGARDPRDPGGVPGGSAEGGGGVGGRNRATAEQTVQKYFGVHKYLEEYNLDVEKKRQLQIDIGHKTHHLNQLREILEDDDAPRAADEMEDRPIPKSLRVDNLLGLDVFQMILAVACPIAMLPDMTPHLPEDTVTSFIDSSECPSLEEAVRPADAPPPAPVEAAQSMRKKAGDYAKRFQLALRKAVLHPVFVYGMLGVTVISVVALSTDFHGISEKHAQIIDTIDMVCVILFIVEFFAKFAGLGFRRYVADRFNVLDFFILLVAVPDLFIDSVGISALRAFRALRLLSHFSDYQKEFLSALGKAAPDIGAVILFMCIFIIMYSLMGVSLFEGKFPETSRETFDSLWEAAILVFVMIAGDGWTPITKTGVASTSPWAAIFFVGIFLLGTILIMSMFPAILIDRMTAGIRSRKKRMLCQALRDLEELGIIRDPSSLSQRILNQRHEEVELLEQQHAIDGQKYLQWRPRDWSNVPRGTVLQLLGSWKAEISVKRHRPFWVNTLTGMKTWENPNAAEESEPVKGAANGAEVEVWRHGDWHLATVIGRRENGTYTVALHSTGEVQSGVQESLLRQVPGQAGDPDATDPSHRYSPAHSMLRSKGLLGAYNHPDMGGLMLLWCALGRSSKRKLEKMWSSEGSRDSLLYALAADGTLNPMPQPYHDEESAGGARGGGGGAKGLKVVGSPGLAGEPGGSPPGGGNPLNPIDSAFPKKGSGVGGRPAKGKQRVHIVVPETGELEAVEANIEKILDQDCNGIGGGAVGVAFEALELMHVDPDQAYVSARSNASTLNGSPNFKRKPRLSAMKLRGTNSDYDKGHDLADPQLRVSNRSLGFFSRKSKLRRALSAVVFHKWFDDIMLAVVLANAVFLALDDYYAEERPGGKRLLYIANIVFVTIYLTEMAVKIIVLGLFRAPCSYFRGTWNRVDAVVALSQVLELVYDGVGTQLRGARTIRLLVRLPEVRIVCEILIRVLPKLVKVLTVHLLVLFIFGVIGVTAFKGQLYYCTDSTVMLEADCVGTYMQAVGNMTSESHAVPAQREWKNNRVNFDNLLRAFFALIELSSGEGWRELMYRVVDAQGVGKGPSKNAHPERALYFITFLILGHFILAGVLLGVMVHSFFASQQHQSRFLTVKQRNWLRMQRLVSRYDLQWRASRPLKNEWKGLKLLCFKLNQDKRFDVFVYSAIVVNSVFLATTYYGMTDTHVKVLHIANIVFITIYILEALVRWAALGFKGYIRDPWNRFDLFCITLSVIGLFLALNTTIVRIARVIRGIRLLRKAKRLNQLIYTLHRCLPALLNVSLLLLYIFFNWGIVGVSLFQDIKPNAKLNRHESFKTLPEAMLFLFQISTTETWTDAIEGTSVSPPDCEPDKGNCGNYAVSVVYFSSAMMVGAFVFVNLFLYVVLETYIDTRKELSGTHSDEVCAGFDLFRTLWTEADPYLRRRITIDEFLGILQHLPPPLWSPRLGSSPWLCLLENVRTIPVPITAERDVSFDDCMLALALKAVGMQRADAGTAVRGTLTRLRKFLDPSIFTVEHCVAARRIADLFRKWKSARVKRSILRTQVEVQKILSGVNRADELLGNSGTSEGRKAAAHWSGRVGRA